MPVFEYGNIGFPPEKALINICQARESDQTRICSDHPTRCSVGATFLIDTNT